MSVYLIANYDITNADGFATYPELAGPTVMAHGGEILAADFESEFLEGSARSVSVVLRFPSREAVDTWYNSEEYRKVKNLRTDNSEGFVALANEFQMPA